MISVNLIYIMLYNKEIYLLYLNFVKINWDKINNLKEKKQIIKYKIRRTRMMN